MRKQISIFVLVVLCFGWAAYADATEPKVSKEQATKTALEQVKNGTVKSAELEMEKHNGKKVQIWSFDIAANNETLEVWVDAQTGKVIKNEKESKATEKKEEKAEAKEKSAGAGK